MAILIDGKAIAADVKAGVAEKCAQLKEKGVEPALAVILVGEDPASQVYVRNKARACKACGMKSHVIRMPEETTQEELVAKIREINADDAIHGLLIQLPLPKHLDEAAALSEVDWRMLNMLYHPAVHPGMTWPAAQRALHDVLGL